MIELIFILSGIFIFVFGVMLAKENLKIIEKINSEYKRNKKNDY